ncbi:MAG: hypothetical protein AAB214_16485 [Fibrobacterota bacterium]
MNGVNDNMPENVGSDMPDDCESLDSPELDELELLEEELEELELDEDPLECPWPPPKRAGKSCRKRTSRIISGFMVHPI